MHWHKSTWMYVCPHPDPPSHLPPHPIPLGHPSAPASGHSKHGPLKWLGGKIPFVLFFSSMRVSPMFPSLGLFFFFFFPQANPPYFVNLNTPCSLWSGLTERSCNLRPFGTDVAWLCFPPSWPGTEVGFLLSTPLEHTVLSCDQESSRSWSVSNRNEKD